MTRVIVDVMPKPEILDPQGQAIRKALDRLGFASVAGVRQGKRFELELDGVPDDAALQSVREMASTLLANTVIEDFVIRVESAGGVSEASDRGTRERSSERTGVTAS